MVTVLIGSYCLSTGQPCVGVVNQPFVTPASSDQYRGQAHWGLCVGGHHASSVTSSQVSRPVEEKPRVLIGSAEEERIIAALSKHFAVVRAGGAGHKLLMVALGLCISISTIGKSYINKPISRAGRCLHQLRGLHLQVGHMCSTLHAGVARGRGAELQAAHWPGWGQAGRDGDCLQCPHGGGRQVQQWGCHSI